MITFDLDTDTGILTTEGRPLAVVASQAEASLMVCSHLMICGDETEISLNGQVQTLGDLRDWLSRVASEAECENEPIH